MNQSESITALAKALIAVQSELTPVLKDKVAKTEKFSYGYVGLDGVMPIALKALSQHGLGIVQTVGNGGHEGGSTLTTMLLHESGEFISDTQPLIIARLDSQGVGSAITYARRYGIMAMIGMVAEEDDDGRAASPRTPRAAPQARSAPATAQKAPLPTETGEVISEAQQKYIHTLVSKEYANKTLHLQAIVQMHCPQAWRDDDIHTTGLTKAQASVLINALVDGAKEAN